MRDWLPPDHPVWLVITAVADHMDTSAFHAGRKTGGAGTAGYDPDMLVTVLAWAYAHQVTSSRRIEQLCHTDVAFRVICGGDLRRAPGFEGRRFPPLRRRPGRLRAVPLPSSGRGRTPPRGRGPISAPRSTP